MRSIELSIRRRATRQRITSAWLIPSSQPHEWLEELLSWELPLTQLSCRLISLAEALAAHQISETCSSKIYGLLVTAPPSQQPKASQHCHEYGCETNRLFLPVEAELQPVLSAGELAELLSADEDEYVFHPAAGFIRFEPEMIFPAVHLVAAPQVSLTNWDRAVPGTALPQKLHSVQFDQMPSVESLLKDGAPDIGTGNFLEDDLTSGNHRRDDRSSNQQQPTQSSWSSSWKRLMQFLRLGVSPQHPSRKWFGWFPRAEDRSSLRLNHFLEMLRNDPDDALRFAIPLSNTTEQNTESQPPQLNEHDVDFNWDQLNTQPAGGRSCTIEQHEYRQLLDRYHALARREIELGRYRRAAYVYAHLLGDFLSAARALKTGQHYREAALIYRDRLSRFSEAAECFEKAGLFTEAIELYEKHGGFGSLIRLYQKLNQREEAWNTLIRAIDERLREDDYVRAAEIVEQIAGPSNEAISILQHGFKNCDAPAPCLRGLFRLYELRGDVQSIIACIQNIPVSDESMTERAFALTELLEPITDLAVRSSDPALKEVASDQVRVIAATVLKGRTSNEPQRVLQHVERLVAADRLLQRDCLRYIAHHTPRSSQKPSRESHLEFDEPLRFSAASLGNRSVHWKVATANRRIVLMAGISDDQLVLVRFTRTEFGFRHQVVLRSLTPPQIDAHLLLTTDRAGQYGPLFHCLGTSQLIDISFPVASFFHQDNHVQGHASFRRETTAIGRTGDGLIWTARQSADSIVLEASNHLGHTIFDHSFSLPPQLNQLLPDETIPTPMVVSDRQIFVAVGPCLICIKRGISADVVTLPEPIRQLASPVDGTSHSVIATTPHCVYHIHESHDEWAVSTIEEDVYDPVATYTSDGSVLIMQSSLCSLYRRTRHGFRKRSEISHAWGTPTIAIPSEESREILIAASGDLIAILRVN